MHDHVAVVFALGLVSGCASVRDASQDQPPGEARLVVDGTPREIRRAFIWSMNNANDQFQCDLDVGQQHESWQEVTVWNGEALFKSHSTELGSDHCYFQLWLDRPAARTLAESLRVPLNERKDPGHRLSGWFEVIEGEHTPAHLPVRFHLRNVGDVPILFRDEGQSGDPPERDYRFQFEITLDGIAINTVELPEGGFRSVDLHRLVPGEELVLELDLCNWADFGRAGKYIARGRYDVQIRSQECDDEHEPSRSHRHECWDDAVETSLAFSVGE